MRQDFNGFCETLGAQEIGVGMYSIYMTEPPALSLTWCKGNPQFLEVDPPPAREEGKTRS
jgi:hypothetical protein